MDITLLKGKLHRVQVTHTHLDYEGSCAIDQALLEAAGMLEYEQIQIYNIANGERFTTYAISGERNSGMISINGAAARKASIGDRVVICVYARMDATEAKAHKPQMVYVLDAVNQVQRIGHSIPSQPDRELVTA